MCGKKGHYAKTENCPTKIDTCKFCRKPGHWSKLSQVSKIEERIARHTSKTKGSAKHTESNTKAIEGTSIDQPFICRFSLHDGMGTLDPLMVKVDDSRHCSAVSEGYFDCELLDTPL